MKTSSFRIGDGGGQVRYTRDLRASSCSFQNHEEALRTLLIPRNGDGSFKQCEQYDINADSVINRLLTQNKYINSSIVSEFVARNRWATVQCRDGWEFDTSEFSETLATKVNRALNFAGELCHSLHAFNRRERLRKVVPIHYEDVFQYGAVCENEGLTRLAQSAFFLGGVFGTIFFGWISDRWGRRPALLSSTAVMLAANVAAIAPPDYYSYIALRCIAGLTYPSVFNLGLVIGT